MATDKRLISLENTFKALADQTRLRVLGLLRAGEICVCDIHGSLGLPQPTVSRHLAYLRKSGLVATRKEGQWVHYRLADLPDPVMQALLDAVTHAISHVSVGDKDRRRLATRIDLTPLASGAPARCCC
jgi:ArsR family transcriptional regulator, arsenate/arsenite/antimonite-responsive transcriptional repressor